MGIQAVNNVGDSTAPKPRPTATSSGSNSSSAAPPTEDTVSLSREGQSLAQTNAATNAPSGSEQRKLSVTENNDVVLKVIDPQTQEVVRSVPSEEQLQLRDAIRNELDNS